MRPVGHRTEVYVSSSLKSRKSGVTTQEYFHAVIGRVLRSNSRSSQDWPSYFLSLVSIFFHLNPSTRNTETPASTTDMYQLCVNAMLNNCKPRSYSSLGNSSLHSVAPALKATG